MADVPIVIVNLAAYESSLSSITSLTDIPIVQDEETENVAGQYGASKWYTYVIKADGKLHIMHYDLPMPSQLNRLVSWIEAAQGGTP